MKRIVVAFLLVLTASPADARTHRVNHIPYGSRFGCTSCHRTASGGGDFTGFGSDTILALVGPELLQERDVDWSLVYHLDSDLDGFTNGEELNDPMGTWKIGDPNPVGGQVFNPGDPNAHPFASCGDGRVTPPEQCDGTNFGTQSCIGLGLDDGLLVCNADCTFDTSGCGEQEMTDPDPQMEDEPADADTSAEDDAACSTTSGGREVPMLLVLAFLFLGRYRSRP